MKVRFSVVVVMILLAAIACEKKAEKPQPVGKIEITTEPDPLMVAPELAEHTITVTGRETGGAAVTLTNVTVMLTYLDSTHIMSGPEGEEVDLTVIKFTWKASSPDEGGPLAELLEEFWHFDVGEEKEFEVPVKIGYGFTAPEGFAGLYLPTVFIQAGMLQGKEGFLVCLDYKGIDEHDHIITGAAFLRLQFQLL